MPTLENRTQAFLQSRQELQQALKGFHEVNSTTLNYLAERFEAHLRHREEAGNPHGLTKADFGLENLENLPPATIQDIINNVNTNRLLTPRTYKLLIEQRAALGGSLTNPIRTPLPITPKNEEVTSNVGVVLQADEYRSIYRKSEGVSVEFKERQFQLDLVNGDFTSPVFESTEEAFATNVTLELDVGQSYKWRCRDIDENNQLGNWSIPALFNTQMVGIARPTLTIEGGTNSVVDRPLVTASALNVIGGTDTLVLVEWFLKEAGSETYIWTSGSLSSTVGEQTIHLPEDLLEVSRWYTLEVEYTTSGLGSKKSVPLTFRTRDVFTYEPGSRLLETGDSTLGFYDVVDGGKLFTSTTLATATGVSSGTESNWASNEWMKLSLEGTIVYVAKYPVRVGVTLAELTSHGVVAGKTVSLQDTDYKVRLMSPTEYNTIFNLVSELGTPGTVGLTNIELGIGASYTDTLLNDGSVIGDGSLLDSDVDSVFSTTLTENATTVWRPILVLEG